MVRIAELAKSHRIAWAYGETCCLEHAPSSFAGRIDFRVYHDGSFADSAPVQFQPWREFLRAPAVATFVLDQQWIVGTLTVEAPIALRVNPAGGTVFGVLETTLGSATYELPHGSWIVGPPDFTLLDDKAWTRRVEVPGPRKVTISPPEGIATIRSWMANVDRGVACGVGNAIW